MKKLFTLLTLSMALFAGDLMAQQKDDNTSGKQTDGTEDNSTLPAEEEVDLPAEEEAAEDPSFADLGGDSGDTAWMIVATAIVLMMTIPGLSLFYAGLTRRKNVLSVLVQCFAITCLMTLLWTIYGYSLAYTEGNAYIGGFDKLFLKTLIIHTGNLISLKRQKKDTTNSAK